MTFAVRIALPLLVVGCAGAGRAIDLGTTRPGVYVRLEERSYDVHGRTVEAIQRSKLANAPERDGTRYSGYTNWQIHWRYGVRGDGAGCRLTDVRVTLDLTIDLPRWTDSAMAPDSLVAAWHAYEKALRLHEQGHAQLSLDAANQIREAFSGFRSGCGLIRDAANGEGNARLAELRRRHREYDDDTGRGARQGAVWPPPGFVAPGGGRTVVTSDATWVTPAAGGWTELAAFALLEEPDSVSGYRRVYLRRSIGSEPRLIYEHRGSVTIRLSHGGEHVLVNDRYDDNGMRVVLVDLSTGERRRLDEAVQARFHREVTVDRRLVVMPRAHAFSADDQRVLISMRVLHVDVPFTDEAVRLRNAYEPRWYVVDTKSGRVLETHRGRAQPERW